MENQYRRAAAAKQLGVHINSLYAWEKRKAAGHPRYADYPAPLRLAHSNQRIHTDADIERIRAWKDRTEPAQPASEGVDVAERAGEPGLKH